MNNIIPKDFTNKRVCVLGLGAEGETLCRFLLDQGAQVTVADRKTQAQLFSTLQKLAHQSLSWQLGSSYLEGLAKFEYIFRSPGVYRYQPELAAAEKAGTGILSEIILFFKLCPAPIIGVTGTKGKGTTSLLIGEMLKESGKKVFVAGNLGPTRLNLLKEITPDSLVVLELSSFQLIDLRQSPKIAVVLNIGADHLNWHRNLAEYRRAKENLVKFQTKTDFAVINADYQTSRRFANRTEAQVYFFSRRKQVSPGSYLKDSQIIFTDRGRSIKIGRIDQLKIRGRHNWENVLAAASAARLAGAKSEAIGKVLRTFSGWPHRLEEVAEVNGVLYVNDSASTLPETAQAALASYRRPIILICGGSEKNLDFTKLGRKINQSSVKTVILIGETADRIQRAILEPGKFKGRLITGPSLMTKIVAVAESLAQPGDLVLLSPACASFDMFLNYQDRGNQFRRAVADLTRKINC